MVSLSLSLSVLSLTPTQAQNRHWPQVLALLLMPVLFCWGMGGAFRLLRSRFFVRAEFAERQVKGKDGEIKVSKGFSSLWPLVCLAACLNYRCSIANLFQLLPRCSCCGCFCVVCVCVCVCVFTPLPDKEESASAAEQVTAAFVCR